MTPIQFTQTRVIAILAIKTKRKSKALYSSYAIIEVREKKRRRYVIKKKKKAKKKWDL